MGRDTPFDMPQQFWIIIAVGAVLVVLLALFLGRKLKLTWGDKSVETDAEAGASQSVSASGKGAQARNIKLENTGRVGKQEVSANDGGKVQDVRQKLSK